LPYKNDIRTCAGNPFNPSYEVHAWGRSSDDMSLSERVSNTLQSASSLFAGYLYQPVYQRLMDSCFNYTGWESRPSLGTLLSDTALLIQNSHHSLNYPHPLLPTVINAAGMHMRPLKALPKVKII
jgi:glucuronosyltransferase